MRIHFVTFLIKCLLGKNVVYVMIDDFGWGDFGYVIFYVYIDIYVTYDMFTIILWHILYTQYLN